MPYSRPIRVVIVTTKRERHWQRTWTNLRMKGEQKKNVSSIESNVFLDVHHPCTMTGSLLADWSIIYLFKGQVYLFYYQQERPFIFGREVSIGALLICLDIIGRR